MPRGGALRNTLQAAHSYVTFPYLHVTHTLARTNRFPSPPGIAHWACIQKASALGFRVGWTAARSNERTAQQHSCHNVPLRVIYIVGGDNGETYSSDHRRSRQSWERDAVLKAWAWPRSSMLCPRHWHSGVVCISVIARCVRFVAGWLTPHGTARFERLRDFVSVFWFMHVPFNDLFLAEPELTGSHSPRFSSTACSIEQTFRWSLARVYSPTGKIYIPLLS